MDSPLPTLGRSSDSWDAMLPGPPSRSNFGSLDVSPGGLLAYGAGSSVAVADPRSMQLVSVLPMPAPSPPASPLAPFVTSVRWAPHPLPRDLPSAADPLYSLLRLAAGDRQGRIALWDFRSRLVLLWLELDPSSKLGIQDLCWIRSKSWLLASIHGPSLIALWNLASGRCIWKYDASPEYLSCLRRDPFDARHFCALGLQGFLLSAIVLGDGDKDVSIQEQQIPASGGDFADLQKIEKEKELSPSAPALAAFPTFFVRLCFSPRWRQIVTVMLPKELIVFDLQYGTSLSSMLLPRGCSKFMDLVTDPDMDLLYCVHLDGKLSIWKRKEEEQVHLLCTMVELMPSIGTTVPTPAVLAVSLCQLESVIQNVGKLCSGASDIDSSFDVTCLSPLNLCTEMDYVFKTYLISISDDGKIWNWLLTSDKANDAQKTLNMDGGADIDGKAVSEKHTSGDSFVGVITDVVKEPDCPVSDSSSQLINSSSAQLDSVKVERSLLVTGFGYEHDDAWATNINLFKEFTDISRGVRRLGAAAVDMSHVALGIVEAYWEYRLKPWDMAAGVLIVEEAGGVVTRMDGGSFSVFDRSVLVSNGIVHDKLLERIGPATEDLGKKGIDFSLWFKPENYITDL